MIELVFSFLHQRSLKHTATTARLSEINLVMQDCHGLIYRTKEDSPHRPPPSHLAIARVGCVDQQATSPQFSTVLKRIDPVRLLAIWRWRTNRRMEPRLEVLLKQDCQLCLEIRLSMNSISSFSPFHPSHSHLWGPPQEAPQVHQPPAAPPAACHGPSAARTTAARPLRQRGGDDVTRVIEGVCSL